MSMTTNLKSDENTVHLVGWFAIAWIVTVILVVMVYHNTQVDVARIQAASAVEIKQLEVLRELPRSASLGSK